MPDEVVKILTVCTHNRTRSVMSMAMLQAGFDRRLGIDRVIVRSLGFGPEGMPAIPDAVDAMKRRGLDVSGHASRHVTADRIGPADLILTAEKDHVIDIAAMSDDAYRRTFTLPELLDRVALDPDPGGRSLRAWMTALSASRSPADYLGAEVPEVADPTGTSRRNFEAAVVSIEAMCARVVDLVAQAHGSPDPQFEF